MLENGDDRPPLLCSVIIPVYNGAATIAACLDGLAQQTTPPSQFEVIVVDDGSRDQSVRKIIDWQATHPLLQVRLLQQPNGGPASARNAGVVVAQAPILLFTDADCRPGPAWIATMVGALRQPGVSGVKGVYRSQQREWVAQFVQAEYEDRYDRMRRQAQIDFIDTYSAAYWRTLFVEHGGFDPRLIACEDQEFSFRLVAHGHRLVFTPAAWVEHRHVTSVWAYARRKYAFGFWKARLTQWHPDRLVQDSHTPQTLKAQMGLALASVALALVSLGPKPLHRTAQSGLRISALLFVLSALGFLRKLAARSLALALVGLWMLPVRAFALSAGFLHGKWQFAHEHSGNRRQLVESTPVALSI
jgi:glycosyltransferase involved in cell wall biosynthesis